MGAREIYMRITDPISSVEDSNAATKPIELLDHQRILAFNGSSWPVELLNEIEGGRDGTGENIEAQGEDKRFFGTHIKEAIDAFRK